MAKQVQMTPAERSVLIKTLISLSNNEGHIPFDMGVVAAKVSEYSGRDISEETCKKYCKSFCNLTWERKRVGIRSQSDRVVSLADATLEVANCLNRLLVEIGAKYSVPQEVTDTLKSLRSKKAH